MSKPHFLIALLAVGIAAPAWSQAVNPFGTPAGKCDPAKGHCVSTIVFSSACGDPNTCLRRAEIFRISTDDRGVLVEDTLMRLTENEVGVNGLFAGNVFGKLSPHGKWIVFDSNRDRAAGEPINTSDLFSMKADGKDQKKLTRGSSATWSPNGKYLAFHRSASDPVCPPAPRPPGIPGCPIRIDPGAATWDSDIFIMRMPDNDDGLIEAPINVTNTESYIESDADWSPNGQKIVFTRHSAGTSNPNNFPDAEICVLDLETPDIGPACYLGVGDNNFEEERGPAWSPDGTHIAYMCRRGQPANLPPAPQVPTFEICVMTAEGTDQKQLTVNSVLDGTPTWSPDGLTSPDGEKIQRILFSRGAADVAQLWHMNADGTDQTRQEIPAVPSNTGLVVNLFASWGQLWVGGRSPR
jgi:hypothetical protein